MASPLPATVGANNAPASHVGDDSDSEWEYEYSTTETETYYVTLDISKPDFVTRQQSSIPSGRGGYKERALTDIFAKNHDDDDLPTAKTKKVYPGRDADDDPRVQPRKPQEKEPDDQVDLNEFQVLDLHSENPLVAYRGRIYEGHWAQNIGTELLFTQHDEHNPLPAVRQLDNGVDLLAASSARILLTEKSSKPAGSKGPRRHPKVRFETADYAAPEGYEAPAVPDPEPGASTERYEQGDFLAKLIALKKRKGETDEVTVIARLHDEGKKKAGQKKSKVDSGEAPAPARGRGRGGGRPRGRGKGRARGRMSILSSEEPTSSEPPQEADTTMDEATSQLTPGKWPQDDDNKGGTDQDDDDGSEDDDADEMDVGEGHRG